MNVDKELLIVEQEIEDFIAEIKRFTAWKTGEHILDYINTRKAFDYGILIGRERVLEKLKEEKNVGCGE